MTISHAFFLGALQGLTEFLPVSSSGHLVLAETFMGLKVSSKDLLGFDVLLHAGTAAALLAYYWSTWRDIVMLKDAKHTRLLAFLIIATIPGAVGGLILGDVIAVSFRSVASVAGAMFVTAIVLILAHFSRGRHTMANLSFKQVMTMGIAQAFALIPGISRSGITISAGQMAGLSRSEALDFSFMMALPIILGATAMTIIDVALGEVMLPPLQISILGFGTSFVVSLLAILTLRTFVQKHSLAWFAVYLVPISLILMSKN